VFLRVRFVAVFIVVCTGVVAGAAPVLFPEPLHLTRAVEDPLRRETTIVEEFYLGNRVISVAGDRTVIADYDRGEVIEIDRAEGTYSVTPFATIAAAATKPMHAIATQESEERWSIAKSDARSARPDAEVFSATPRQRGDIRRMEVAVDRSVSLTRDALDVIIGAAYPNERSSEAEVYVRAAAAPRGGGRTQTTTNATTSAAERYALPVEESVTYDAGTTEIVRRTRVTRIGKETPVTALLTVPPGARLIESRRAQTRRMLDELDTIPSAGAKPSNDRR
jgi:hypothetical protein